MIDILRTNADNVDLEELIRLLDADLAVRDGDEHSFYAQYNKLVNIHHVVIAYKNNKAVGCGAIKEFDVATVEIKRMFVREENRGQGIATLMLSALEAWVKELNYTVCILETGKKQPEAISLYEKLGYVITPNFGQYIGVENSVCMRKEV